MSFGGGLLMEPGSTNSVESALRRRTALGSFGRVMTGVAVAAAGVEGAKEGVAGREWMGKVGGEGGGDGRAVVTALRRRLPPPALDVGLPVATAGVVARDEATENDEAAGVVARAADLA